MNYDDHGLNKSLIGSLLLLLTVLFFIAILSGNGDDTEQRKDDFDYGTVTLATTGP